MLGVQFIKAVNQHHHRQLVADQEKERILRSPTKHSQLGWYDALEGFSYEPIPISQSLVVQLIVPKKGNIIRQNHWGVYSHVHRAIARRRFLVREQQRPTPPAPAMRLSAARIAGAFDETRKILRAKKIADRVYQLLCDIPTDKELYNKLRIEHGKEIKVTLKVRTSRPYKKK